MGSEASQVVMAQILLGHDAVIRCAQLVGVRVYNLSESCCWPRIQAQSSYVTIHDTKHHLLVYNPNVTHLNMPRAWRYTATFQKQ